MIDFWAELPSPVKARFRRDFQAYADQLSLADGTVLSSYMPAPPAGSMPREDYLSYMDTDKLPVNYLTLAYGECSGKRFYERFLETGIYDAPQIAGYFAEVIVLDTVRLGSRKIPARYEDLADPIYKDEICMIGGARIPDPIIGLYISRSLGEDALIRYIQNINCFSSPAKTIRHIGKRSNHFGSIFIMPVMFAECAAESNHAVIVVPEDGYAAEPLLLFQKKGNDIHTESVNKAIRDFIHSPGYADILEERQFLPPDTEKKISDICKMIPQCDEVDRIWAFHRQYGKTF